MATRTPLLVLHEGAVDAGSGRGSRLLDVLTARWGIGSPGDGTRRRQGALVPALAVRGPGVTGPVSGPPRHAAGMGPVPDGHRSAVGDDTGPVLGQLTVPRLPASIASVRRFAVSACRRSGFGALCESVALLVSEVATNALVHGSGEVRVQVRAHGSRLRVEVADDSPGLPRPREAGLLEEGGRGLALVDSLADDWGVQRVGGGKVVWFELS